MFSRVWSWFRDKENRATIGFILGGVFGVVPAAFVAYKFYFGDPFAIPDMKEVCFVPKEGIPDGVHTILDRNALQFVTLARKDHLNLSYEVKKMQIDLHNEHSEKEEYKSVSKLAIDMHFIQYLCRRIQLAESFGQSKKNQLRILCNESLIPKEKIELLKKARFEPIEDPKGIAGEWYGQYFYASDANPDYKNAVVDFQIRIVRDGFKIYGGIFEKNTFSDNKDKVPELFSTLRGKVDGNGSIFFEKQYQDVDGVRHSIYYQGLWDPNGETLRGTWNLPKNPSWWGRFIMQKS